MAGAAGSGQVMGLVGGTMGGIGDLLSALNYQRPRLKPASGMELRLRQLAQNQLLGGGQQLLGGAAMYNQMAPLLMGMLPGMSYVPGTPGGGASPGASGGMPNYAQAAGQSQQRQGLQQQLNTLNSQMNKLQPGPQRHSLRIQRHGVQQQLNQLPPQTQLDRQQYMTGTQAPLSLYDIRQGNPAPMPGVSDQSSLAAIRGYMDGLSGSPSPDFLQAYYGGGGPQSGY